MSPKNSELLIVRSFVINTASKLCKILFMTTESELLSNLRALRALQAVAVHGSTVAAAHSIHLSQPAITRAIGKLEQLCGLPLFVRTTKGMQPTAQGAQLALRTQALQECLVQGARDALALRKSSSAQERPHGAARFAQSVSASQIRALLAVAACGSELRAAAQLKVSQPAIYTALQELARLLDVELFYKLPSGTRLTPPGEALLLRVKQAVAELRGMAGDLAAWRGTTRGCVQLGVLPLSASILLPQALDLLAEQHPDVKVTIIDGAYPDLLRQLLAAEIDAIVGALRSESPSSEISQQVLFDDDLVVIAHRDHPCFQHEDLRLADLQHYSWVAPLINTPADHLWRSAFAACGLPAPDTRLAAGSPAMTRALALQSGLLALASRGEAAMDGNGLLRIVPVALPGATRSIGIAMRTQARLFPELQAFLDCCQKLFTSK